MSDVDTHQKKTASPLPSRQGRPQEAANAQTSSTAPCSTLHTTPTAPWQHPAPSTEPFHSILQGTLHSTLHSTRHTLHNILHTTLHSTLARLRHRMKASPWPDFSTSTARPTPPKQEAPCRARLPDRATAVWTAAAQAAWQPTQTLHSTLQSTFARPRHRSLDSSLPSSLHSTLHSTLAKLGHKVRHQRPDLWEVRTPIVSSYLGKKTNSSPHLKSV